MKGDIRSLDHIPQKFGQARGMVRDPAEFAGVGLNVFFIPGPQKYVKQWPLWLLFWV